MDLKFVLNGVSFVSSKGFNCKGMINYPKEEKILAPENGQHDVAVSRDFLLSLHSSSLTFSYLMLVCPLPRGASQAGAIHSWTGTGFTTNLILTSYCQCHVFTL